MNIGNPSAHLRTDYRQLLTQSLIKSIQKVEEYWVKKECDGSYIEGDSCGLGFDPIWRAQDTPDYSLFRTIKGNTNTAIIGHGWPANEAREPATDTGNLYYLVKQNNRWMIDGIDCQELGKFNIR